jgi:hypothetical protein
MSDRKGAALPITLFLLALLAVAAYLPSLTIPLLEDDYPNLWQSLNYGAPSGLPALFHDPVFRLRATSYWAMYALWQVSKVAPLAYHVASLLLHIANVWLLYGICAAWPRMRGAAFWAAAFFAVHEGHQEAVMWFSAINELFLFLFGMAALWCWIKLAPRAGGWRLEISGVLFFALALISKESAVVILPLFLLALPATGWRRTAVRLLPFAILAGLAIVSVVSTRTYSFRFSDGSFSLRAPFWITWPRSYFRVLWIWGLVAGAAILLAKDRQLRRSALAALAWIGIALAPYSFLTYSTQIPSRQTYLASAGLALLFGLAMGYWSSRVPARPRVAAAVLAVVLAQNMGYLWVKKRAQFVGRAAPTDQLIALARRTHGPIWVRCFPRTEYIAEEAVHLAAGYSPKDLVWTGEEAERRHAVAVFCYREGGPEEAARK